MAAADSEQSNTALEFRKLTPEMEKGLADFFAALEKQGDTPHFHPHPFTAEEARKRCLYTGRDLYYVAVTGKQVLAYGMLRGWDEGYEIPSLGIAVHPNARGMKLGLGMMHFLHSAARQRGAKQVRLKVHQHNIGARSLYEQIGYKYTGQDEDQLIGFFEL
jgi:[ribosomal protein S18]-alanine N-acetyltransferase